MNTTTSTVAGLLLVSGFAYAGPIETAWVDPGAHWVAHVDIERAMTSNLVREILRHQGEDELRFRFSQLMEEITDEPLPEGAADPAFDLTQDLKGVTLFGSSDEEPEMMVVQTSGAILEFMQALEHHEQFNTVEHAGHAISRWVDGEEELVAIVQPSGVAGTFDFVVSDSVDRLVTSLSASQLRRAGGGERVTDEPEPGSIVYVRVINPGEIIKDNDIPPFLANVDGVVFNLSLNNDVWGLMLDLDTGDQQAAQDLRQAAMGLMAMGRMMLGGEAEMKPVLDLVSGIRFSVDGQTVSVNLNVDSSSVQSILEQLDNYDEDESINIDLDLEDGDAGAHIGAMMNRRLKSGADDDRVEIVVRSEIVKETN